MSRTMIRSSAVGALEEGNATAVSLGGEALAKARGNGLRLAGSLLAVVIAGFLYRLSGWKGPWFTLNLLPALAGSSAFLLLAFGFLGRDRWDALLAIAGSGVAFGFAYAGTTGAHPWLAAAFATHAVTCAALEWRVAEQRLPIAGSWSTFSAVMTVLLLS